jgi:nitrilase
MTAKPSADMTVAVVQIGSTLGDVAATVGQLERACRECAASGARLAVFPEALIGGYPKGMVFGASLGIRTDEGRTLFRSYSDCAIEVPGPVTDAIGEIAKAHSLYLVAGVVERDGGTLYCTAIYISADGRLLGKHRKLVPTAIERIIWGCGDGSTLTVVESPIGRFGALICWENYMPLARMSMYLQGVQIYCAPTVDDRESWIPTMRHIAREGRCFVLSSCQYLTRAAYPPNWLATTENLPDTPIRGGSCILDPTGEIIAGPLYDRPGLLTAKIDLSRLPEAKFDFDVAGHYARPDVFSFSVRTPES